MIKKCISRNQTYVGPIINFASEAFLELVGIANFDLVMIDAEHGPMGPERCENIVRTLELANLIPLVRVPNDNPSTILKYLDIGFRGIQVPHICSAEQAQRLVQSAKYQPIGQRGIGARQREVRELDETVQREVRLPERSEQR